MIEGAQELRQWLFDAFRQGLGNLQSQPSDAWEAIASSMSNAKLATIARRIRKLKKLRNLPDWPSLFIYELADFYLFAEAFIHIREFPINFQEELLTQGGRTPKEKDLLETCQPIEDQWLIIGQTFGTDEDLRFQRTWLVGSHTAQMALLLEFAWRDTPFKYEWHVGSVYEGGLVFYPGLYPLRAVVSTLHLSSSPFLGLRPFEVFTDFADIFAQASAKNPWIGVFPCLLENVSAVAKDGKVFLVDPGQHFFSLTEQGDVPWKVLAQSGGRPITLFGEWKEATFSALTLIHEGSVILL